jgi:iron complex transport system ATP-binding protein
MVDAFAARLHLEAVGVRYGAERALERVDFTARAGEFVALVGPNGSGKSSLLRAVAGLQRHEGRVRLEGAPASAIGFMPQDNGTHAALTVLEATLLGRMRALGLTVPPAELDRAVASLDRLGIAHLAARRLTELSGGQRQLVFLAQLLASEPAVLLLDEPTSALDMRNQLLLLDMLAQLAHANGLIVVAALHDLNAAARFADRVLVLDRGRLVADGSPAATLTAALIAQTYRVRAEIAQLADDGVAIVPVAALDAREAH